MFGFVKRVFSEYGRDKVSQLSAAFAYTAIFSIGPLLLVFLSIIGFIYGERAARGELYGQLSSVIGSSAADTVQRIVAHTSHTGSSMIALVFGIIGVILGATAITGQLQQAFDQILRAVPDPKAGIKFTVYTKLKNFSIIVLGSLVVIASLVISSLFNGFGKSVWLDVLNNGVSLVVFIWTLYLVYRFLPDVVVPRRLAVKTAAIVSLLFLVGKIILGIIIGRSAKGSTYGAAASLVALLLWFYYSGQILMLGAEGIKVHAENNRLNLKPKRFAVKLKELDVYAKKDLRGRALEAFARGYKSKSSRR
jgi:membrane protein